MSHSQTGANSKRIRQDVSGASWTIASRIIAVAGQIGFFLLVARIAGPAPIGEFALASAVAFGLGILGSAGWRQYGGAHAHDPERLGALYWTASLTGVLVTLAGLAIAAIAAFMAEGQFSLWLVLLSLGLVPQTLGTAFAGQLIGLGRLRALAVASIIADLLGMAVAVLILLNGYAVAALVALRVVMLGVSLLMSMYFARPLPRVFPQRPSKELMKFSATFLATAGSSWLRESGPLFVVGGAFGAAEAGIFRTASRLSGAVKELAIEAAGRLSWARFGRVDSSATRDDAAQMTAVTFALSAPVFIGLALVAEPLLIVVLGPEWREAGKILVLLALARFLEVQLPSLAPALAAKGRFRIILGLAITPAVFASLAAGVASMFGLIALGAAILTAEALILVQRFWVAQRIGHLDLLPTLARMIRPTVAVALMTAGVGILAFQLPTLTPFVRLVVLVGAGAAIWTCASVVLLRPALKQFRNARPSNPPI